MCRAGLANLPKSALFGLPICQLVNYNESSGPTKRKGKENEKEERKEEKKEGKRVLEHDNSRNSTKYFWRTSRCNNYDELKPKYM